MEDDEIEETMRSMFRMTFCGSCTRAVFCRIGFAASVVCMFLCSFLQYVDTLEHSFEDPTVDPSAILARLTDLFISGGALASAPFLCLFTQYPLLGRLDSLLVGCACLDAAKRNQRSLRKNAPYLGSFIVGVALRFVAERCLYGGTWPARVIGMHGAAVFRTMTFAFSIAALLVVARLLQALGDIMVILIDSYGSRSVFGLADPVELRRDWNVMQAKCRQATIRCEPYIAILVVTVTLCMTTSLLAPASASPGQLRDFWGLIFTMPLAIITMRFFVRAAEVTALCRRIPSLLSSSDAMTMEADERFLLVHHIQISNPGFYVREVIISTSMLMKTGHIMLVAASAILSRYVISDI
mmetsp:Transcript_700/g.2301  ORF Transcript_700/g.2301 Transcript_700/m.2301 type:complete len:354 (+) Transcript_700:1031-2092(+)